MMTSEVQDQAGSTLALSFLCPSCKNEIVVQFLRVGDTAFCWSCGSYVEVPATASEVDAKPAYMVPKARPQPQETQRRSVSYAVESILGPRSFGGLIKEIARVYKVNSVPILYISAILYGTAYVVQYLLAIPQLQSLTAMIEGQSPSGSDNLGLYVIASSVITGVTSLLVTASLTMAVAWQYVKSRVNLRVIFKLTFQRIGLLISTIIVMSIVMLLLGAVLWFATVILSAAGGSSAAGLAKWAMVIFALVIAYIFVRLSLAYPAALVEKIGPIRAISQSWHLVGGHWWQVLGCLLLIGLMVAIMGFITNLFSILGIVAPILLTPFMVICYAVLYFNLRVLKDGYTLRDLECDLGLSSVASEAFDQPAAIY